MDSSRRDLSNYMAKHRPILKNDQNTYHLRFGFLLKTGIAFSETRFRFYCVCAIKLCDHVYVRSTEVCYALGLIVLESKDGTKVVEWLTSQ